MSTYHRSSYGFKYCVRFSAVLMEKLSPADQLWLKEARGRLQKYMEQGLIDKKYRAAYDKVDANKLIKAGFEEFIMVVSISPVISVNALAFLHAQNTHTFNDNFEPSWLEKNFYQKRKLKKSVTNVWKNFIPI